MNPALKIPVTRSRPIDPNRLTLPIELLALVFEKLPCCIAQIESEVDYLEMERCIDLMGMALAELKRLHGEQP